MRAIKTKSFKVIALVLAFSLTFSMTACNNDASKSKWTLSDGDIATAIEVSVSLEESGSQKTLSVTYSDDLFKSDIGTDDVVVQAFAQSDIEEEEEDTSTSLDVSDKAVPGISVTYISAKEIEVSFKEERQNIWMYYVYVHPDAVTQNVFAVGEFFPTVVTEIEATPSLSIEGEYSNLTEDPVISLVVEDTDVSEELDADDISLGGAFSALSIASVNVSGNTIRIGTQGKVAANTSLTGMVTLSAGATAYGTELSASIEVSYKAVYIDDASWEYDSGALSFEVVSLEDKITGTPEELQNAVSLDRDMEVSVLSISDDGSSAVFGVAGESADEIAASLNGATLQLDGAAFASKSAHSVYIALPSASLGAAVDYVSVEGGVATATAYLYASNGTFSNINKNDVSFTGDYFGAEVASLEEQTDGSYILTFTFKTQQAAEELSLSGAISLTQGKVLNLWGTESGSVSADALYTYIANRGEVWDNIKGIIDSYKGVFSTIGTVGSAVGGVASAIQGIQTILQICGVLETTDDKLEKINESLENIQSSIKQLDNKLDTLSSLITQNNVEEAERSYLTLRNNASQSWDAFLNRVSTLDDAISSYTSAYYGLLLDTVNSSSSEVTLYWNAAGDLTVPGSVSGYDLTGTAIVSEETVTLNCSFDSVRHELALHGNAVYDGFIDDVTAAISEGGYSVERAQDIADALTLGSAKRAIELVGAQNIVNAFLWPAQTQARL